MSAEASITPTTTLTSTAPGHGYAILGDVRVTSAIEITDMVMQARQTQQSWRDMNVSERVEALRPLINIITDNAQEIATRTSREMGMAMSLSNILVTRALEELEWNLAHAADALKTVRSYEDSNEVNEIIRTPFGVVACIAPWNFPLPNFMGSVIPALLGGNAVIIKFSEEIALFSHYFEALLQQLNLPAGLLSFVHGDGQTGAILADAAIDMIIFTGSFATGQRLAQKAAEKFIPIITELGGSSPGIVFDDANLDQAIPDIYNKRFSNCGQFCSGLKRLMVDASIFDTVCDKLVAYAQQQVVGDPLADDTTMGPLVAQRQLEALEKQIADAKAKGAHILHGGKRPDHLEGAYYEPTLLTNITKDMHVWTQEVFGPALPILPFNSEAEAIELAHDTEYGLTAYFYTQDAERTKRMLHTLQAGVVTTQNTNTVRPENPFGGYFHSGIGRVRGVEGFHQVTQTKLIAWQK